MEIKKINIGGLMKRYANQFVAFLALVLLTAVIIILGVSIGNSSRIEQSSSSAMVFTMPILNADVLKDYSNTELQWNQTLSQFEIHKGIDFLASSGTNVHCFADGVVSKVYSNALVGTCVEIQHDNSLKSVYQFLDSNLEIKEGDTLTSGQVIGRVATEAGVENEDGCHLHFEVWKDGSSIDPSGYLDISNK